MQLFEEMVHDMSAVSIEGGEVEQTESNEEANGEAPHLKDYQINPTSNSTGSPPVGLNGPFDVWRVLPYRGGPLREGEPRTYRGQRFVANCDFTPRTPNGNYFDGDIYQEVLQGNAVSILF